MTASLDSKYVIAPSLEMYFVAKDTGLPLTNGQVFFYKDQARNIPKDVFQIVSAAPGGPYTYVSLPNPSTLSAVGTFQDNDGNDIIPYYYPYDSDLNIELYYIEVYDSNGVLQFTREAWPNFTSIDVSTNNDVTNFVPNGQFLAHNNIPASSANNFTPGKISQNVTQIAQGGWEFVRSNASTAIDIVTFPVNSTSSGSPTGNPRYSVNINTDGAGSDTERDLRLKFPSVNTFASDTQAYNFYFEAESLTGSSINNVQIFVRKFFGTGGSPSATTITPVNTITLVTGIKSYNTTIIFGSNSSQTLGTNNDDYVEIVIRLPPTSASISQWTDFALTLNNSPLIAFPTQTNSQQLYASLPGFLPTPDANGNDLYLPSVLTPTGMTFDHSSIGSVVGKFTASVNNELLCDGSAYLTADYSSLGIPYTRLFNKIFQSSSNAPLWGTGTTFVTCSINSGNTSEIVIRTNQVGAQTIPADGSTPTHFTFNPIIFLGGAGIGYSTYVNGANNVITAVLNTSGGTLTGLGVDAGTSGMSVSDFKQPDTDLNTMAYYYVFLVTALSAASLAAGGGSPGKYFKFSNSVTTLYIWFQVTTETDPTPGGTGVKVKLESTMNANDVANVIAAAIANYQVNTITVTGASAPIAAGSFFTFHANSLVYNVWYKVAGVGAAPVAPSGKNIQVTLAGTETAAQVATATQIAINSLFFAVPDLRGMFLRGNDPTGIWDLDVGIRGSLVSAYTGTLGTLEIDSLQSHWHGSPSTGGQFVINTAGAAGSGGGGNFSTSDSTDFIGERETRPLNFSVNWYIKY